MTITLKRPANCKECGAPLPAGTRANWYRNGDVYGYDCHARKPQAQRPARTVRPPRGGWENEGHELSAYDPYHAYAADGTQLGRISCGCEDWPCCGH